MVGLEDRRYMAQMIEVAHRDGARLSKACKLAGINVRTLQRWKAQDGLAKGDRRPDAVHPKPAHALTPKECAAVLEAANEPRFADMPPARIVPMLARSMSRYLSRPSCRRRLFIGSRLHGHADHNIALRIQGHGLDRIPVAGVA